MIAAVAYLDGDLYVRFNKGAEWKYAEVPATVYSDFRAADSLGKFFHAHIRKDYADTAVN